MAIFYIWYSRQYLKLVPRIREKRLTAMQISLLKYIALILIFPNNLIIIAYGKFDNEFLRISVTIGVGLHIFYTDLHWIVRIIVSKKNTFFPSKVTYIFLFLYIFRY